jgi:hypothetical protein
VQLQETSDTINRGVLTDKIFTIEYELDEFQNKPRAREDMFKAINDGKLVWYYIGHGSFDKLGAEDYYNGAVDMNRFTNEGKLPLFVTASCDIAQYDSYAFDCLAEKTAMLDNRGAISSIGATRESLAYNNVPLFQNFFQYAINLRNPTGYSLTMAKFTYTGNNTNDEKYNLLGDPLLPIIPPVRDSSLTITTSGKDDILSSRELATLQGSFPQSGINLPATLQVFNCDIIKSMPSTNSYSIRGGNLYKGDVTLTNSQWNASFIVPDDVTNGNTAVAMAYIYDPATRRDYINYLPSVTLNDQAVAVTNPDAPAISLYLDSESFTDGSSASTSPLLIARLSDQNGINTTNAPGHSILLIIDQSAQLINVTDLFKYDQDSYTEGEIRYQLSNLSEGEHTVQLIAFDNFNLPSVKTVHFKAEKRNLMSVSSFLPYPNPLQKTGYFTFVLSDAAEVKLSIYTVRGKKLRTINFSGLEGYNQIPWDGRDADGDHLANNTYFIKLTAKSLNGRGKAEKTEKLVIYH